MTNKEIKLLRGRIYRELSFLNKAKKRQISIRFNENETGSSSTQESDSPNHYKTFRKRINLNLSNSRPLILRFIFRIY